MPSRANPPGSSVGAAGLILLCVVHEDRWIVNSEWVDSEVGLLFSSHFQDPLGVVMIDVLSNRVHWMESQSRDPPRLRGDVSELSIRAAVGVPLSRPHPSEQNA